MGLRSGFRLRRDAAGDERRWHEHVSRDPRKVPNTVRDALASFDPTHLLFLRKLARIEIQLGAGLLKLLHRKGQQASDGSRRDTIFETIADVQTEILWYKI